MSLIDDFRQAARSLRSAPGFLALSAVVLALGLGATIFMFGVIDVMLHKPPPFPGAGQLYRIGSWEPANNEYSEDLAYLDYVELRESNRTWQDIAATYVGTMVISGEGLPERLEGGFVTWNLFSVLGVRPLLGRDFAVGDDVLGAAPTVILSHALWRTRFDRDPQILGQSIRVNGRTATVIGVMPENFGFPGEQALWTPMARDQSREHRGDPNSISVAGIGRLRDGVTPAQASDDLAAIAARLARQYPQTNGGTTVDVLPIAVGITGGHETANLLYVMFGAVWLVLLIACANVASLIFVRANFRVYESSMRVALGARRARLVSEVLAESVLIALLGVIGGLALASVALHVFERVLMTVLEGAPPWWQFGVDWRAALFAVGAALVSGLIAGVVPALRASRPDVMRILRDGGRTGTGLRLGRFTTTMVIVELALSAALLTAAGLMMRGAFDKLTRPIGADVSGFMSGRIMLPETSYAPQRRGETYESVVAALAAQPGALEVAAANAFPGVGSPENIYAVEGREYTARSDYPQAQDIQISRGFFAAFGLAMLEGRVFDTRDRWESLPVAIVNEAFARKHFGGRNVLGRRVRLAPEDPSSAWRTIVGVAPNIQHDLEWAPGGDYHPVIYTPLTQAPVRFVSVGVKVAGDPHAFATPIREAVQKLDADLAVYYSRTIEEHQAMTRGGLRVVTIIFAVFAGIALALSAAGIYGVLAFNSRRRNRELGVRRALGARDRQILATVMRGALVQLAIGLGLGALLAPLVGRALENPLQGLPPDDPVIYALTFGTLMVVAMLASWVPALRALQVDPATALRYE